MPVEWNNFFGPTELIIACLALIGGLFAARKILQMYPKAGRRDLVVFTRCYLIWVVMGRGRLVGNTQKLQLGF